MNSRNAKTRHVTKFDNEKGWSGAAICSESKSLAKETTEPRTNSMTGH
jgi:hypothetical protein